LIFAGEAGRKPDDKAYRDASQFIEDGVVYRLTWGIEAVRVRRPDLIGGDQLDRRHGLHCTALLEYGTLNASVVALLQLGLPSRKVAHEVVAHERLGLLPAAEIRNWLRSQRLEPETRWSYLDDAARRLWMTYITESDDPETGPWTQRPATLRLSEQYIKTSSANINGMLRRKMRENDVIGEFQQIDGTPLGISNWPFGIRGPDFAPAILGPEGNIGAVYWGPRIE